MKELSVNMNQVAPWCSSYHYCTTSFNKAWTQVLCGFKSCSQCVGDHYGEDLWQWSRLEMRLNPFHQSTIPQKQFIIIHHWFAKSVANSKYISLTWIYCCKISTSSSFGSVWLNNFLVQFLHFCWPRNIS